MMPRLVLLCLFALPMLPAQAAKKPEPKPHAAPETSLGITAATLQAGMKKYIQEEADCRSVTFGDTKALKKGARVRQRLQRDGAQVDVTLDVSKAGNVSNARFAAPTKDPAHLTVMLCATYAVMRTLQPKGQALDTARSTALEMWQKAQQQPVQVPFAAHQFRAQMKPFELNVM
jgi:hypothetical protein